VAKEIDVASAMFTNHHRAVHNSTSTDHESAHSSLAPYFLFFKGTFPFKKELVTLGHIHVPSSIYILPTRVLYFGHSARWIAIKISNNRI
jgi:hypothetical protein